jgi:cytochrome c oxidase cbb3-type subunit 3
MKTVALLLALIALTISGCEREARRFSDPASNSKPGLNAPRLSVNQPAAPQGGGVAEARENRSPYIQNAYSVNQGKRLYKWFNCSGCHASGGGSIGPPLMDTEWRYGSDPANIFASIMQGRPNGMPSFGGHIPDDQAWQIVAYVQSMSGGARKDVAPSRSDGMYPGNPENARSEQPAQPERKTP